MLSKVDKKCSSEIFDYRYESIVLLCGQKVYMGLSQGSHTVGFCFQEMNEQAPQGWRVISPGQALNRSFKASCGAPDNTAEIVLL